MRVPRGNIEDQQSEIQKLSSNLCTTQNLCEIWLGHKMTTLWLNWYRWISWQIQHNYYMDDSQPQLYCNELF